MLLRLASVLMLAVAALTAGCASDPGPPADVEYHSRPLTPDGHGAKKPKARKNRQAGHQPQRASVVAGEAGIAFRAPTGWSILSDGRVSFLASSPRMKALADKLRVTPEQLRAQVEAVDVFASGFGGSLTVASDAGSGGLPSKAEIQQSLAGLDATVQGSEDVSTPLGAGRIFAFDVPVNGSTAYGSMLCLVTGGRGIAVIANTLSPSTSRGILADVIPTLRRS